MRGSSLIATLTATLLLGCGDEVSTSGGGGERAATGGNDATGGATGGAGGSAVGGGGASGGSGGAETGGSPAGGAGVGGLGGAGGSGGAIVCDGDTDAGRIVYYPFDTCSATTPEVMGTGLDAAVLPSATCTGTAFLSQSLSTQWYSGSALYCDDTGYCAEAPDDPVFEPSQFTFSAWIWGEDFATCGLCSIVSKGNTDAMPNGYWLAVDGNLRLNLAGASQETSVTGTTVLSSMTWHHVVATFDGSTATLYLNGMPEVSQPIAHVVDYGDETFLIGSMTDRDYDFDGFIDEVALRDYVMTPVEVEALYEVYTCP